MDSFTDVPDRAINPVASPVWYISQSSDRKWEPHFHSYRVQRLVFVYIVSFWKIDKIANFLSQHDCQSNWLTEKNVLVLQVTLVFFFFFNLNLLLFIIILVPPQSGATVMAYGSSFYSDLRSEVRGIQVFRCLWLLMPKVWISLKTLSVPRAARNKALAGLNGNPAYEALVSEVTRRQQMNPVAGAAGAVMERRRQRSSFSQVIQGESNEEDWRREKPSCCLGEDGRRSVGKLQCWRQRWGRCGGGREGTLCVAWKGKVEWDIRHI